MRIYLLIVLLNIITIPFTIGQGGMLTIEGRILDKESQKPIPTAYVRLKNMGFSVSPNDDGFFRFQYPAISKDSIAIVSAIGYDMFSDTVKHWNTFRNIELSKKEVFDASFGLSDAKVLLGAAIDSIKLNYFEKSIYQEGTYFDKIKIEKLGLVKMSQGFIRIERFPNEKKTLDKIKLLRGRSLDLKGQSSKVEGWGFVNSAEIVGKSLETNIPEFLTKKGRSQYDFRMDSTMIVFENLLLYGVSFSPKSKILKGGKTGKVYIEPSTKAIVRVEYDMTKEGLKDIQVAGSPNIKITNKSISYYIQYIPFQNKWLMQDSRIVFKSLFEEKLDNAFKINAIMDIRFIANESLRLIKSNIRENELLLDATQFTPSKSINDDFWLPYNYLFSIEDEKELGEKLLKR